MSGTKKLKDSACLAALLAVGLIAACNRSEPAQAPPQAAARNDAAPSAIPGEQRPSGGDRNAQGRAAPQSLAGAEQEEDVERGPTRQARCRIDDQPERACAFTPVFGDGSFDIELPDRQLRLIVSGEEAAPFELIGRRRIPLAGLLRRDPQDRACWVAEDPELGLERVCAR